MGFMARDLWLHDGIRIVSRCKTVLTASPRTISLRDYMCLQMFWAVLETGGSGARTPARPHRGDLVCVNPEGTRVVWQNATYACKHRAQPHFNDGVIEIAALYG